MVVCRAVLGQPHFKTGSLMFLSIAHFDQDTANNLAGNPAALCRKLYNICDTNSRGANGAQSHIQGLFERHK